MPANASMGNINSPALVAANKAAAAGNDKQAFSEYTRLANDNNNPLAMFSLGLLYKNGTGRTVDEAKACAWFEKASKGKLPFALHLYAECTLKGVNHPANPTLAVKLYKKAADMGHSISLCYLAERYMKGEGVPKNPLKALELCHNAVERGSPPALVWMGKFYLQGDKSIQDPNRAMEWFKQAAKYNLPEAQYYIGWILALNASDQNTTNKAREWFEKAASQRYVAAYAPTGKLYFTAPVDPKTGWLAEANLAKAYMWLSAAAKKSKNKDELIAVNQMLKKILVVMPKTWLPELDAKIAQHLQENNLKPQLAQKKNDKKERETLVK